MLFKLLLPCIALLTSLNCAGVEAPACAGTIRELRSILGDKSFSLYWEETTMDDGRPLSVTIMERDGLLLMEFNKTGEGLWAQTKGTICKVESGLETTFTGEQIRLGPAANLILRLAIGNGGKFTLTRFGPAQLRIATNGWKGDFSAKPSSLVVPNSLP
ncbi:MAG: hypothetical protein WCI19_07075 [Betaproteobacteria bacterium]|nr:hypothetical protein [Rhodocyclales bacterium]